MICVSEPLYYGGILNTGLSQINVFILFGCMKIPKRYKMIIIFAAVIKTKLRVYCIVDAAMIHSFTPGVSFHATSQQITHTNIILLNEMSFMGGQWRTKSLPKGVLHYRREKWNLSWMARNSGWKWAWQVGLINSGSIWDLPGDKNKWNDMVSTEGSGVRDHHKFAFFTETKKKRE